ncbi:MAG: NAD(P)/FAD-dependent oxidoreductase [Candidatus Nomurabacteria bacterium]|jgi:pyruvate/2-oxoglutarate dehydrogenase complex dihydrolipoamide dehydrogenase (E3) component|nr:NAD(P)/FAD-dependent oxidoreductase [Candidatus Nomurabacteria bacterium]
METFDFIVLGGGTAGVPAALQVASIGCKVAIVEPLAVGGDAVFFSDIPSRALSRVSDFFYQAKLNSEIGLNTATLSLNFPITQRYKNLTVKNAAASISNDCQKANITIFKGYGSFVDPTTIKVGEHLLSAKKILISIGSEIFLPEIQNITTTSFLTADDVMNLPKLPKSIFIIGGGSCGCEMAEYFAKMGVKVTIAELASRLLPKEDETTGTFVKNYFIKKLGINVLTGTRVEAVDKDKISSKIMFIAQGTEQIVRTELILLATGRSVNLSGLNLDDAGVRFSDSGIAVLPTLQTSHKNIFAAGDCIDSERDSLSPQNPVSGFIAHHDSSSQKAILQGQIAAANAFPKSCKAARRKKVTANYLGLSRITRLSPTVATIGITEDEATRIGLDIKKSLVSLSQSSHNAISQDDGFLKLISDRSGNKLLGACIVAQGAESLVAVLSLALQNELPISALASLQTPFLAYSDLIPIAAQRL